MVRYISKRQRYFIGVEIGIFDSNSSEKVEALKELLTDNNVFTYPDVYKDDPYHGYNFFEPLKNFNEHDKSDVEKWFKEKLKIIIKCTDELGPKVII